MVYMGGTIVYLRKASGGGCPTESRGIQAGANACRKVERQDAGLLLCSAS